MSEAKLKELIKKRSSMKAKLTHFNNYFTVIQSSTSLSDVQIAELDCRLNKIDSLYGAYDELQTEVESISEDQDLQFKERESFESQFYTLVSSAHTLLNSSAQRREPRPGSAASVGAGHGADTANHDFVRLPKIDMPHFGGDFQYWLEFRDTYLSLIHNNNSISNINKFHYLRAALQGSASHVIKNLDFRAENYPIAWQLLSDRYDNERLLINNHINALFNVEAFQKESSRSIRNIIDVTNKNLRALASLGQPTDHWDTLIIYIMSKKLDNLTYRYWEEHRNAIKGIPTFSQFIKFLNDRADLLDTLLENKSAQYKTNTYTDVLKHKPFISNATQYNSNNKSMNCPMCKQNHYLFSCQPFRDLDVESRLEKMKNFNVCKNCLRPGHAETRCRLSHCKYCSKRHNTLLHTDINRNPNTENNVVLSTDITSNNKSHILLSTALVKVSDSKGSLRTARVLLDNGSTSHFVTRRLCEQLGLVLRNTGSTVTGINHSTSYSAESCDLNIQSNSGDYKITLNCNVLPNITQSLPSRYINIQNIPLPMGIELADPNFNIPSAIDILVGAEIFWDIVSSNIIDLGKQYPKLQKTKLGWLISGAYYQPTAYNQIPTNACYHSQTQNNDSILTKFWELDSVSSKFNMSKEEQACEVSFAKHTRRVSDGRFEVHIPLKESPSVLGDSFAQARQRLLSIERKFERDSLFKSRYLEFMSEYLSLGHMSETTDKQKSGINYYVPHHGIVRESSTTTKLRAVFDASAPTTTGKSFNDIQMVGPVVQNDLFSLLLRFRQHRYVVSSDVEKMYRSILVTPTQRMLQQILFRFNKTDPIKTYTLNTVTYGTASAPYLATKCLVSLADYCSDINAKKAIQNDFYVDDFLSGGDSIELVIDICKRVDETLKSAHFYLRKWQSNNSTILSSVTSNAEKTITEKTLNLNNNFPCKTLGLYWDPKKDHLLFSINLDKNKKITKRVILSLISQVFDPLGLLGPCVVEAKIIMQKLWLDKNNWDDEVSPPVKVQFDNFITSLNSLNSLKISRWVYCTSTDDVELHTFTDASERAYGACVYVRTSAKDGSVYVRLLCSKNKVAPIKPTTMPRLELCGALLGTRLCTKVLESLTVKVKTCFFWTDSTIVLNWLNTPTNRLKTFVRNRVGEIQDSTASYKWSYVPSKDNPADLVSRGLKADCISGSDLWWSGPSLLQTEEIQFPVVPNISFNQQLPELSLHVITTQDNTFNTLQKTIHKISNYSKLIRIIAYVLRFIHNCRNRSNPYKSLLSLSELKQSEIIVLQTAQQEMFASEYKLIKSGNVLNKKSRLNSLSPFIDANNLLRVGGRLNNSQYSYDIKHPILLCSKHHITRILFNQKHRTLLHAGPQLLLSHIRQTYWPLNGRDLARSTVHRCVRCSRFKPKPVQPIMSDLPKDRTELEFPFFKTGVDYAGPVMIVNRKGRGSVLIKSYICVFVCFAVKAVHLELVSDLTKETFISALQRFIARRGKPHTIYSDHGTTFVGASNEIASFLNNYSDDIQSELQNHGINFKHIPPYSPHFGGLWEAAVKSVKHHLKRILSLSHLTYEEMSTCLVQIEAVLNSRPLTPLSTDPTDLSCLTPAHFLIGRSLMSIPQPPLLEKNISRLQRFQRIEILRQHFWQRFSSEYVSLLQQKVKWKTHGEDLKLGALVLVKDKNQPPLLWLLGRVVQLHPGQDGIHRVADVKTRKGIIQRAYNNLCPLPIT